jgi:hypothetical protein
MVRNKGWTLEMENMAAPPSSSGEQGVIVGRLKPIGIVPSHGRLPYIIV